MNLEAVRFGLVVLRAGIFGQAPESFSAAIVEIGGGIDDVNLEITDVRVSVFAVSDIVSVPRQRVSGGTS